MAFGSQNGSTNGGFGSKNGGVFGSNSNKMSGSGISGDGKFYFGGTQNNGTGSQSMFGSKSTSSFGASTTQQTNTGSAPNNTKSNQGKTVSTPISNKIPANTSAKIFSLPCIKGKISQYRTYSDKSGNYRRLLPRKIYQALVYGQRFEDLLHSFIVTEIKGSDNAGNPIQQKYVVNVHGSTNYGATLTDNEEVEVRGKFTHDNIMMAKDIRVINGSISTPIKFQRSVKLIALTCLVVALLILGIIGFASMGSGNPISGFMNNVWSFVTTMFAVYVILLILYAVSSFTRIGFMTRLLSGGRRRTSPLITMLVIAFILTLLLYNVFGLGTIMTSTLSGALSAVGPIIVIIGVVILFKAFK